jgi:hypothetical protein
MYDPLAKDQIGANVFAGATGYKAHQNGATPMQAISTGLLWRYWYKNLTGSIFLLVAAGIATGGGIAASKENAEIAPLLHFVWVGPLQIIVNVLVLGITYVSLVDISKGYKQRWTYRVFAPIQHAMPNVRRFYWYLLLLFPTWLAMWLWFFFSSPHPFES